MVVVIEQITAKQQSFKYKEKIIAHQMIIIC